MRTVDYGYRITAHNYAAPRTYTLDQLRRAELLPYQGLISPWSSPWSEGLTYRDYAHTPRGVLRAVNRFIGEWSEGSTLVERVDLTPENSPADNLFAGGRRAELDAALGEIQRTRLTWKLDNPYAEPWGWTRLWITVERRPFHVDRAWR